MLACGRDSADCDQPVCFWLAFMLVENETKAHTRMLKIRDLPPPRQRIK